MRKELIYLLVFVFFQVVYAIRAAPYDLTSGILISAGLIFTVVYIKYELLSGNRKSSD